MKSLLIKIKKMIGTSYKRKISPLTLGRQGLGLAEVLIALGIMSIFMAVSVSLLVQFNNQVKGLKDRLSLIDLETNLRSSFSNNQFCACNFANLQVPNSPYPASLTIPTLKIFDPVCTSSTALPLLTSGQALPQNLSMMVQSIKLLNFIPIDATQFSAQLEVVMGVDGGMSLRPLVLSNIKMQTTPLAGNMSLIVGCQSQETSPFQNIITFTSNSNWIVPAGVTKVKIEAWGGGGGGGGSTFSGVTNMAGGGGGGSAGTYGVGIYNVVPLQTLTISIGGGGDAGVANAPGTDAGDGSEGGPTSVSNVAVMLSVSGGRGGTGARIVGVTAVGCGQELLVSSCMGVNICVPGQVGGCGMWNYTSFTSAAGGIGGSATNGGAGGLSLSSAARIPGGGGFGGVKYSDTGGPFANGAYNGRGGASGLVVIYY